MKKIVMILLALAFISSVSFAEGGNAVKSVTENTKAVIGKVVNVTLAEPAKGINAGAITIADDVGKATTYTVNSTAKILGTSLDAITLNQLKIGDKIKIKSTETNEAKSIKVVK